MNKARQAELIAIAETQINEHDWFDYHDWDGLIECDETLTVSELEWMRENLSVTVVVTKK